MFIFIPSHPLHKPLHSTSSGRNALATHNIIQHTVPQLPNNTHRLLHRLLYRRHHEICHSVEIDPVRVPVVRVRHREHDGEG
jgi:hypothetical protein